MFKRLVSIVAVGFAVVLGACANTGGQDRTAQWLPGEAHFLKLDNGMTLRYVSAGEGPPVVLIHTIRTQLDYFQKLVPLLQGRYRVYAIDLPGHGGSSTERQAYTEAFMRRAVGEFLVRLDLRDVTLAGNRSAACWP